MTDEAFNIAKNPKYDRYQRGLVPVVCNFFFFFFFYNKNSGSGMKKDNMSDQQLAEELRKPIIRNFKKRKILSSFINNIRCADLVDMQ